MFLTKVSPVNLLEGAQTREYGGRNAAYEGYGGYGAIAPAQMVQVFGEAMRKFGGWQYKGGGRSFNGSGAQFDAGAGQSFPLGGPGRRQAGSIQRKW